jgi:hypothetical protein
MNSHLTYRIAEVHQQDLHRTGEGRRAARAAATPGRLSSLCQRILNARPGDSQPQAAAPAPRPAAGVIGGA